MADVWCDNGVYVLEQETHTGLQQMRLSSIEARKIANKLNAAFQVSNDRVS